MMPLRARRPSGEELVYPVLVAFFRALQLPPKVCQELVGQAIARITGKSVHHLSPAIEHDATYTYVWYPSILLGTADLYNVSRHVKHARPFVVDPQSLDVTLFGIPATYPTGGIVRTDAHVRLFSEPFCALPHEMPTLQTDVVAMSLVQLLPRFYGLPMTALHDNERTGIVRAYQVGSDVMHWYDVADENARSIYFPNWEQLSCPLRERLHVSNLLHERITQATKYVPVQALLYLVSRHSIVAVKGSCGCGKTIAIASAIRELRPRTVLVIVSRRLLAIDLHKVLAGLGFVNYLDVEEGLFVADLLICSIDSLGRIPSGKHFDMIVLDETPELYQQLLSRTINFPKKTFALFVEHVRAARNVILASDDLSFDVIQRTKNLRGNAHDTIGYYEHDGEIPERNVMLLSFVEDWVKLILELARKGKRVAIPCSSKEMSKGIAARMRLFAQELRVFEVNADADDMLGKDVCLDQEHTLAYVSVLIYTATLGSGVSIDKVAFEYVFQYVIPDQRLTSQKQALFRVRNVTSKTYVIYIAAHHTSASLPLTKADVRRAYDASRTLNVANPVAGWSRDVLVQARAQYPAPPVDEPDSLFLQLALDDELERNIDRTHFTSRFTAHLHHDCACTILSEEDTFNFVLEHASVRVMREHAFEAAVQTKDRQGKRKQGEAERMSQIALVDGEIPAFKKRQRKAENTADNKFRFKAAHNAMFMNAVDETTFQPAPYRVHASVHADLNQRNFVGHLRALHNAAFNPESLTYDAAVAARAPSMNVPRNVWCVLMNTLFYILGFPEDPLLYSSTVPYWSKDVLPDEHSAFVFHHTALILMCVGGPKKETFWYWTKGRQTFFQGALDVYDEQHPFPELNCPKQVVYVALCKMLEQNFDLTLEKVDWQKNARRPPGASVDAAAHRGKSLKEIHTTVIKPAARAAGQNLTVRVNPSVIALGPHDKVERMFQILEERARNGDDTVVADTLAARVAEYRTEVQKRDASLPKEMRGSLWFAKQTKATERAKKRARKEAERNAVQFGNEGEEEEGEGGFLYA